MINITVEQYILFFFAALAVVLPILGSRSSIPLFPLLGRWIRWLLFGVLFAISLKYFDLSYRADWVHFVSGLALWFILETSYNWIAIKALSGSDLPLFPQFYVNTDGDEWPADQRYIELREWLRSEDYKHLSSLKAELFAGMYLRACVYESSDSFTRIQILLMPTRKGGSTASYTVRTCTQEGQCVITDNLSLPYGGYYPSRWNMCRKPLIGSLRRLLALHKHRLIKMNIRATGTEDSAVEEINDQQRILERLNTDTGFLVPRHLHEEEGKITPNGRYRLWKEMWLIAYLGKPTL